VCCVVNVLLRERNARVAVVVIEDLSTGGSCISDEGVEGSACVRGQLRAPSSLEVADSAANCPRQLVLPPRVSLLPSARESPVCTLSKLLAIYAGLLIERVCTGTRCSGTRQRLLLPPVAPWRVWSQATLRSLRLRIITSP